MNALAPIPLAVRPDEYRRTRFEAFRVCPSGRTLPIAIDTAPESVGEAVMRAQYACEHKDGLLIRETDDERGTQHLHVYAIRKKAARWIGSGIDARRIEPLEAQPLIVIDMRVLECGLPNFSGLRERIG